MMRVDMVEAFDDGAFDIKVRKYEYLDPEEDMIEKLIEAFDGVTQRRTWNGMPIPEYIRSRFLEDKYAYLKLDHNNNIVSGGHPTKNGREVMSLTDFINTCFGEEPVIEDNFDSVF